MRYLSLVAVAISLGSLLPNVAFAEKRSTTLEEVMVTAQKREESLQDTPISIAAFSADKLERFGIDDLEDLTGLAPNVDITPFPNSRSSLVVFMRGVGNNDSQTTQDPSVGVYLDGVYVGRSAGLSSDIAALERIEVLRGPQGTLYGRNTTGGAINIITKKPEGEFGFRHTLSVGNRDFVKNLMQIESPQWGSVATNLTLMKSEKAGWVKNEAEGEPDFGEEEKTAARLALRWDVSETIDINYAYDLSEIEGPQQYYQPLFFNEEAAMASPADAVVLEGAGVYPNFRERTNQKRSDSGAWGVPVLPSDTDISGHTLIVEWETALGQLKLTAAHRELDESIFIDYGAGFRAEDTNPANSGPFFHVNVDIEHEQNSLELQLVGDINERLNYVAGLYYFEEEGQEDEFDTTFTIGGATSNVLEDRSITSENEAAAIYGQFVWTPPVLKDNLDLTLGLRYTKDDRAARKTSVLFENGPQEDSESFSNFNPSLTANYALNEDISFYAKAVTGYKSGGYNVRSTESGFQPAFEEEEMVSYEVGAKAKLFNNRLQLNVAVFESAYENIQIQQITDNSAIFLTDVFNVGEADINGFEVDISAVPLPGLTVSASYGYTNAEFTEYIDQNPNSDQFGEDRSDDAVVPYAPEKTFTVGIDYLFPEMAIGDIRFNVDYAWRDERFGTALNPDLEGFKLDNHGVLNARLSLSEVPVTENAKLELALWGKNIDKEDYLLHQISFGFARSGYWNEPHRYGADLTLRF